MSCKWGGHWYRPFGDVENSVEGFKECAGLCLEGGYKYFGMECPRPSWVHCQCAKILDGSSPADPQTQCAQKARRHFASTLSLLIYSVLQNYDHSWNWGWHCHAWWYGQCELCTGPYTQGSTPTYLMGGYGTGSVYYASLTLTGQCTLSPTVTLHCRS